jgi:hypothetical protein
VELLQDWPKVLLRFREMHATGRSSSMANVEPQTPVGNADQQVFTIGLQNLRQAHRHQVSKNFDKVMFNLEVLSFTIWWFRVVSDVGTPVSSHCQVIL